MSMFPANFALHAVGIQGAMAVFCAVGMTYYRITSFGKTPHPDLKRFHDLQLNMAEYHPLLMVLYAVLHFAAKGSGVPLSDAANYAVLAGLLSNPAFAFGGFLIGKPATPNPVRAFGVMSRYISLLFMSYHVTQLV